MTLQRDDFVKDGGGSSARTIAFYGLDDRLCYYTSDRPHTKVDRAALAISYETSVALMHRLYATPREARALQPIDQRNFLRFKGHHTVLVVREPANSKLLPVPSDSDESDFVNHPTCTAAI